MARSQRLVGNCDQAPFSLASMMRGAADWMMDLMDEANQDRAVRLLDHCAEAGRQFIRLMAAAGAHMVSNGDSPAGPHLVSPRIYRTLAQLWERSLVDEAHRLGLPYALHICGRTDRILDEMVATGADALDLDYRTDANLARDRMSGRATFIGSLDPCGVLALGTPELVAAETRALLAIFADTPRLILNAGGAIPPSTPPENLRAMVLIEHLRHQPAIFEGDFLRRLCDQPNAPRHVGGLKHSRPVAVPLEPGADVTLRLAGVRVHLHAPRNIPLADVFPAREIDGAAIKPTGSPK